MAADRQDPGHTFVPPPQIDLSTADWSAEERAQVMAWYAGTHGPGDTSLVPFVPFMIEHNPAGFKRLRQHSVTFGRTGSKPYTYAPVVLFTYAVIGHAKGCLYTIIATRQRGLAKRQVQELLAFAYVYGGPFAINAVAETAALYLSAWQDDGRPGTHEWPEGWSIDPTVFRSGLDFDTPGMTPDEVAALSAWHERMGGEVPPHVALWSELNPASLKTHRARYETGIGETLPAQIFPLCTLQLATIRAQPALVRRSLLQARALGVKRRDIVQTMEVAFVFGGELQMEAVLTEEVAALLRDWQD
jgi:hypothetical protein